MLLNESTPPVAERVTVSYPDDEWVREELETDAYVAYLRGTKGDQVAVGDEWEEFVDTGCGGRRDVVLRVEAVDGGEAIGTDTAFKFVPEDRA